MPRLARHGPYRFFFFSNEAEEAPSVIVQHGRRAARLRLLPVAPASHGGFNDHELRRIESVVRVQHQRFLEVWHAFFAK